MKMTYNRLQKYPLWIHKIFNNPLSRVFQAKFIYILISLSATIWFLIRVLPKPSRANYPCIKVAAPVMSAFIIWVLAISGSWLAFRKARNKFLEARYAIGGLFLILAIFFALAGSLNKSISISAKEGATPWYKPNQPFGQAQGIFPGRVVWTHNPGTATWDGKTGFWWEDQYTNQEKADELLNASLLKITGEKDQRSAWNALFVYFNKTRRNSNKGYIPGERIAIKINQNNTSGHADNNEINTTPQLVLSVLKNLVEMAGVPQKNIVVFDASRYITDNIFNKCHAVFPDVVFVDNSGNDGRVKSEYYPEAIKYSEDNGNLARGLAKVAVDADYIINMAVLKGHVGNGTTLCAKNYYGVTSIDPDWRKNYHNNFNFNQKADGTPSYITFVDFMGHKDLGLKTLLFLVDDIYSNKFVNKPPGFKWQMPPFNGDWPSSLFVSQDMVAIDAVCTDFILNEWPDAPDLMHCDAYLLEAATADNPLSGTKYDPEKDGTFLKSLGVFEHWNNATDKQYSRNLNKKEGIELLYTRIGEN
jgi:hypothetical protein